MEELAISAQQAVLQAFPSGGGNGIPEPGHAAECDRLLHLLLDTSLLALGRSAFDLKRLWHDDQAIYTASCANDWPGGACPADYLERPAVQELHVLRGAWAHWTLTEAAGLIRELRRRRPELWIKMFAAADIARFARREALSHGAVIDCLMEAGLDQLGDSITSGESPAREGGPVFGGMPWRCWCAVHDYAHRAGLPAEAVLHFGTQREAPAFARSLAALRELEERAPGTHCVLLVPASPWWAAPGWCLRVVAAARLALETVPHVKVHLPSLSAETAAAALNFGADVLDLRPMPWADGAGARVDAALARRLVRYAGQTPVERAGILYVNQVPALAPAEG